MTLTCLKHSYFLLILQVKELESQLLIERKLARQHVDSRIAKQQQQMNPQKDEQHSAAPRRPLANRLLGSKQEFQ